MDPEILTDLKAAIDALPKSDEKSAILDFFEDLESNSDVAEAVAGIREKLQGLEDHYGSQVTNAAVAITDALQKLDLPEPDDDLDFDL